MRHLISIIFLFIFLSFLTIPVYADSNSIDYYFFNGPASYNTISPIIDTFGYSNSYLTFDCPVGVVQYYVQYSSDQQTWNTSLSSGIPGCKNGQSQTIGLGETNRYWRVGLGGGYGDNAPLSFVAKAHVYNTTPVSVPEFGMFTGVITVITSAGGYLLMKRKFQGFKNK
jgi:hypothetical protein